MGEVKKMTTYCDKTKVKLWGVNDDDPEGIKAHFQKLTKKAENWKGKITQDIEKAKGGSTGTEERLFTDEMQNELDADYKDLEPLIESWMIENDIGNKVIDGDKQMKYTN